MQQSSWIALAIALVVMILAMTSDQTTTVTTLKSEGNNLLRGDLTLASTGDVTLLQDDSTSTITIGGDIDRECGVVTISNGTSQASDGHSIGTTPSQVLVTGRDAETQGGWVSARDSTTVTITVNSNVSSDRLVDWCAWE